MAIVKLRQKQKREPRKPQVGDIVTIIGHIRDETTKTMLKSGSAVVITDFVVEKGVFGERIESYKVIDLSGEQFSQQLSESQFCFFKDHLIFGFWAFVTLLLVTGLWGVLINTIVTEIITVDIPIYWSLMLIPSLVFLWIFVTFIFIPLVRSCKEYFLFKKKEGE
ncbi:hypothetical protein RBH76_10460 [Oscillospiraceae bacterium MB24-C1]|nr:hypothetical protein RBH76_10460 [Oscillospiraceae bacterium MB24-C1]